MWSLEPHSRLPQYCGFSNWNLQKSSACDYGLYWVALSFRIEEWWCLGYSRAKESGTLLPQIQGARSIAFRADLGRF